MAELTVTPITKARVELLDPFGGVLAEGELFVRHVPGIDAATPSTGEEFAQRFAGKRLTLSADHLNPEVPYSIRIASLI